MTLRIGSISLTQSQHRPFEALSQRIARMRADILLVSGFRTGLRGMMLRAGLDRQGLVYQTPSDTEPEVEALILGSRCPFLQVDMPGDLEDHQHRFLHVCIGDFHLIACDLSGHSSPCALGPYILTQAQGLRRDKLILFSRCSGSPQTTPEQSASSCPRTGDTLADELTRLGFVDAYKLHSRPRGIRLPQGESPPFNALVTPALSPQLSRCFEENAPTDTHSQEVHTAVLKMG